jgi:carbamate kinase
MRIVVALGGNALLERGQPLTEGNQRANARRAAEAIAPLCKDGSEFIITHGNGPQVGLLALQSAAGPAGTQQPLDVLTAETEGMLGYLIEQELRNALPPSKELASILSQVVVDPNDPAFHNPMKPIGSIYSEEEARRLSSERGWSIIRDGAAWRRSVASPRPMAILELSVIAHLASRGVVVICIGGGGIPVVRSADARLQGIEAVIDKDHASALLAREVGADWLLLLTDVDSVYLGWGTAQARSVAVAGRCDLDPQQFEPGSMRPKVEAAIEFVHATGRRAAIGRLADAAALIEGTAGTLIEMSQAGLRLRDRS